MGQLRTPSYTLKHKWTNLIDFLSSQIPLIFGEYGRHTQLAMCLLGQGREAERELFLGTPQQGSQSSLQQAEAHPPPAPLPICYLPPN